MQKLRALSRRTLVIIISSSVLLLGLITYFVFNNQQKVNKINDYTNWKSYTSNYSGFKFSFPENWSINNVSGADRELTTDLDKTADKIEIIDNEGNKYAVFSSYDIFSGLTDCDENTNPGLESQVPDPSIDNENLYGCSDISLVSSTELPKIENLYYVEGVITYDEETFSPICAITDRPTISSTRASYYSPWFVGTKSKNESNSKLVQFACKDDENDSSLTGLNNFSDSKEKAISEFNKDYFKNIRKIMLSLEYI